MRREPGTRIVCTCTHCATRSRRRDCVNVHTLGSRAISCQQPRTADLRPTAPAETVAVPQAAGSAEVAAHRVVQEALTNALKHARGSRTTVRVRHSEKEITVQVSTDGTGARSAPPDGGERGLAGLRERVDILSGDFTAQRKADGGFVVRARNPRRYPLMTEPIRVLVCDDQALIRTGFATIIGAQPGLVVVGECGDGRAAVDLAARVKPDVVVMDVRMPVLDGIDATRLLAGAGVANPVKVLAVTTFNLDEYVYEALRAGASGFLLKDTPPAQLLHGIRTVASGAALLAPEVTRQLVGKYASRITPRASTPGDSPLTARELEVLRLIASGLSNSEIAAGLVISHETIKTYVSRILTKLDLRDRAQAVVHAYRTGLVT
ncbi:response regulator [Cellulomonas chengniuliangii]